MTILHKILDVVFRAMAKRYFISMDKYITSIFLLSTDLNCQIIIEAQTLYIRPNPSFKHSAFTKKYEFKVIFFWISEPNLNPA